MPGVDHDLYFATSNAHKHQELQAILGVPVDRIDIDLPEIQALDVTEVVRAKAIQGLQANRQGRARGGYGPWFCRLARAAWRVDAVVFTNLGQ